MIAILLLGCNSPGDSGDSEPQVQDSPVDSEDTGEPAEECATPTATFVDLDGLETDLTEPLLAGTYTTLDQPGTLRVCPGTWFARVVVRADVHVLGLGQAPADTVLSGGEQGTILDFEGPERLMTVQNLTLDRGAGLDVEHNSGGGGIYCAEEGSVLVEDVVFSDSVANDGPGMYTWGCTVDIQRSEFRDNIAEDDGGALTLWYSTAVLDQVVFEDNEGLDGGAIAAFGSTLTGSNLEIRGNSAHNFGGGMWAQDTALTLTDSVFEDNDNDGTNGGGLLYDGEGAELTRVGFRDNSGVIDGGIFLYWDAALSCSECSFQDNSPNDVWVSDYEPEDYGHAYEVGETASFSCANNACSEGDGDGG